MSRRPGLTGRLTRVDAVVALLLGGALTVVAFTTNSASIVVNLTPNTWVEIVLVLCGGALAVGLAMRGARGPAWGTVTLALFAAIAALSALSIAWSVAPDVSWIEAGRVASYVCAFGGALALARLFPERWRALIGAIAVLAVVLSGWALLVKVFPATLDRQDSFGRLLAPFGYWNATGLIAAMGLPACLWAGARRDGAAATRALAFPSLALLLAVVVLSYSRSAVLAAGLGVTVWFAVAPLRLRGVAVLALGGAGGALISAWALGSVAFTQDRVALSTRVSEGHTFGLVLIVALGLLVPVGFLAVARLDRITLPAGRRRRLGAILIGLVALMPLVAVGALAASSRGLTGEISHFWNSLTNSSSPQPGDTAGRLIDLANSRPQYWREGLTVGSHAPLAGVGAGGFQFAQTRYTDDTAFADYAHSYVIQTFADLGLLGIALSLATLVAWGGAAARTLGWRTGDRIEARTSGIDAAEGRLEAERAGMGTLLSVVITFGVSASIDWSWFIPGVVLPALICAGWLAGRGPLAQRAGLRERGDRPAGSVRARLASTAAVALAVLGAWMVWQPLRSANDGTASMTALSNGDGGRALADAQAAASEDPVAYQPLVDLMYVYGRLRNERQARAEQLDAVDLQPGNAQAWYQVGAFELSQGQARAALAALRRAHRLDLEDPTTQAELALAQAQLAR
jgi:hypothetical protein